MATFQMIERKCLHCLSFEFATNLSQASADPVSITGPVHSQGCAY